MKTTTVVAIFAAACVGYAARSVQPGQQPTKEQMMEVMKQEAAAAPEHKLLEKMTGEYAMTGKVGMGMDLEWKGSEKARMILGGRYLEIDFVSEPSGEFAVDGKIVLGFDKRTKKYTLWTIDSLSTYTTTAQGEYDAAKKLLTLGGTVKEQGQEMQFRYVFDLSNENSRTMETQYEIPGAGWTKQVEVKCIRK